MPQVPQGKDVFGGLSPIGLNGVFFAQECIQLVREKLTIFRKESTVHWLSEDTVKFEVDIGFTRNMQKHNSHFTQNAFFAARCNGATLRVVIATIGISLEKFTVCKRRIDFYWLCTVRNY